MLQKVITALISGLVMAVIAGCPNGSDRIFGQFGLYYGVSQEGYIAARYRVSRTELGHRDLNDFVIAASQEIRDVVRGRVPLRNGIPSDLKSVRSITIMAIVLDEKQPANAHPQILGVVSFRITDLDSVCRHGISGGATLYPMSASYDQLEQIAIQANKDLRNERL